jgi:single-strand DNA-binding protein
MYLKVTAIGRVSEPEMRYTPDGAPVCTFSVATTKTVSKAKMNHAPAGWKESQNGKNYELTTWLRVTCWRQLAEVVNSYLHKGQKVFVEGELKGDAVDGTQNPRVWTGADGQPRASYELTASTIKFLSDRDNGSEAAAAAPDGYEEDF